MGSGRALTGAELLDVVDAGTGENAAVRAAAMLGAAATGMEADERERLGLGRRDAFLLELRCDTYGDVLVSQARCPECGTQLTVRIPREHVARQDPRVAVDEVVVEHDGVRVHARAPDSADLAAAAACRDVASARSTLIARCITSAQRDGSEVDPLTLDEETVRAVGEALASAEPQAEVPVPMACALCQHEWSPVLDIAQYLWRELSFTAGGLLDDIHALARGYGWSEEQVLALPAPRRRQYVERLGG